MVQRIINEFFFRFGNFPLFFKAKNNSLILMYHGVTSNNSNVFNARHIPIDIFEKHIYFLSKNTNIRPLNEVFQNESNSKKLTVAITFDDGYENNFNNAAPILEKYNIPASFFITALNITTMNILWADFVNILDCFGEKSFAIDDDTFIKQNGKYVSQTNHKPLTELMRKAYNNAESKQKLIETNPQITAILQNTQYDEYWKLMTDSQIKQLSKNSLFEIGSHGFYHNNMGYLSESEVEWELQNSKQYLESITQKPVTSLAYPDGSYSLQSKDIAKKCGYNIQLATDSFLFEEDATDNRITTRCGVYNCGKSGNQLFDAIKK